MKSTNTVWHNATVTRARRERSNNHRGVAVWYTGLSGSGKSTLAHTVEEALHQLGCQTYVFDGDNVRHGLCADLGFSPEDRSENIRRIGEMVRLFVDAGVIAQTAFISPFLKDREFVRQRVGVPDFVEVYCRCPIEICEQRDVKGLYKKARAGEIPEFTGISSPYEEPQQPDLIVDTSTTALPDCVEQILRLLAKRRVIRDYQSVSEAASRAVREGIKS